MISARRLVVSCHDSAFWRHRGEKALKTELRLNTFGIFYLLCAIYKSGHGPRLVVGPNVGLLYSSLIYAPWLVAYGLWLLLLTRWRGVYLRYRIPIVVALRVVISCVQIDITERIGQSTCYSAKGIPWPEVSMMMRTMFMIQTHNNIIEVFFYPLPFPLQLVLIVGKGVTLLLQPYTELLIVIASVYSYWMASQRLHYLLHLALVVAPSLVLNPWGVATEPLHQCSPCAALILLLFLHLAAPSLLLYCYYHTEARNRAAFLAERGGSSASSAPSSSAGSSSINSSSASDSRTSSVSMSSAAPGSTLPGGALRWRGVDLQRGAALHAGGAAVADAAGGAAVAEAAGQLMQEDGEGPLSWQAALLRHTLAVLFLLSLCWRLAHVLALDALPALLSPDRYSAFCPAGPTVGPATLRVW